MNFRKQSLLATSCLWTLVVAMPAYGQTATENVSADVSEVASENTDTRVLEGIVVTANKREQSLLEVPAAVSAVSGDTLVSIGAVRMEDYVARIPGLILDDTSFANGANQLTMRGLNTGTGGNPTVGVYIDDAPYGGSNSSSFGGSSVPDLDPFDLERVEVLRGPQGTLYGAGSLGGLFKFVTVDPDPTGFYGRVQLDGQSVDGGDSGYGVRAAANVPVSETVALRVSGFNRRDPGYVDNLRTGETDVNTSDVYGGRFALGWDVSSDWSVRASVLYQEEESDGSAVDDHNTLTFAPVFGELRQSRAPGTGETGSTIGVADLKIEGDLGFATLTSVSSYNEQTLDFNLDVTDSYGALLAQSGIPGAGTAIVTDAELEKFTQEIRLTSSGEGALSWMAGVFYTDETATTHQYLDNFLAATGEAYPAPIPTLLDAFVDSGFEETAVFGNVSYAVTPKIDVTAGIRYSNNRQPRRQTNEGLLIGTGDVESVSEDNSTTYLLSASYRFDNDLMLYARYATGFRPGGPNNPVPGTPASFGPDRTANYEIGLKGTLFSSTLTFDVAAYHITWEDIQLNQRNAQGLNFNGNGGEATSSGVEASATWQPLEGLSLVANTTFADVKLSEDLPPGPNIGLDGDRLPSAADWISQVSADYDFPLTSDWMGTVGGSWRYVGERDGYFVNAVTPRYELPSYDVVDLRVGLRNDTYSVSLFAKNVGDTYGQVASYILGPSTRVSVIQPRTYGISLSSTF